MLRLLLAALLMSLAGCAAPAPVEAPDEGFPNQPVLGSGAPAERSPDLDAARARWADAGLDAYAMTLQRICFCPSPDYTGPFDVVVRDGGLESVRLNGAAVESERGMTVAGLFDLIDEAYDKGAETVDVAYDPELGHPTSIGIDYDTRMADEEIAYRVTDLRAADR